MGSSASKAALGATTNEPKEPTAEHLADLIQYINETNRSVEGLVNLLFEKTGNSSCVVVFKALVTVHHLMVHGNERFIRHLASRNSLFTLHNFVDKSDTEGYTMSTFIRRYSRYLNEKSLAYRMMGSDITKTKRGLDGMMRTMNTEELLSTLGVIQTQFDALLNFNANPQELTNCITRAAFMLLFKDSLRLFAAYNEGILNLLDKYFHMKKHQCRESLDIYIKFLGRTNKLAQLLKVAEQVGIDQNCIPYLTQTPCSFVEALEQHLASLEEKVYIFPPNSLQHALLTSISSREDVELSPHRACFSGLSFEDTPIRFDMQWRQPSEDDIADEMLWHLSLCTNSSPFWNPLYPAPYMVQTPEAYSMTSQQLAFEEMSSSSMMEFSLVAPQDMSNTPPGLRTSNLTPFRKNNRNMPQRNTWRDNERCPSFTQISTKAKRLKFGG